MPLTVEIQDERGQRIGGPVFWSMPAISDCDEFPLLRFVDPYGDTTFNVLQIPVFLDELVRLRTSLDDEEQISAIEKIESLARPFLRKAHHYLKLIGD